MMSIVGLSASNPDIKRGIQRTQIFWQLTRQFFFMQLTPWTQTAGSAPRNPSLGCFIVQSIRRLCT
jgi:hypothetical protein